MGEKNRFGLDRYIPKAVKKQVRRNSRLGCVVPNCRNPFYEYEHITPEFKDAKQHNPDKICLVCPVHNPRKQGKEGQELYSKEQLEKYYQNLMDSGWEDSPPLKDKSFFSGFEVPPTIKIGESSFESVYSLINIDGANLLSFSFNSQARTFEPKILFSGTFRNSKGEVVFQIEDNNWLIFPENWDITVKNGEITIFESEGRVIFGMKKIPSKNTITITDLDLSYPPFHIKIDKSNLYVGRVSADFEKGLYLNINGLFKHSKCGVYLTSMELSPEIAYYGFRMSGETGAELTGNGIFLGKGGGALFVRAIQLAPVGQVEDLVKPKPRQPPLPKGANYFVKGRLEEKVRKYPLWIEKEYYLNMKRLHAKPVSWGELEDGSHVYYISKQEEEDWLNDKGFLGYFADDLLDSIWSDYLFEVSVEGSDEQGTTYTRRVKRIVSSKYKVINELDEDSRPFVPNKFAGTSPWKEENKEQ